MVFHDVTQSREIANKLSWQATHDQLTGLVNRREFEHLLEKSLSEAQTTGHQHALLYLDLDQFKVVNDTCGHVAGDELLRQVSSLLQGHMRANDTLARLGGDEFGVLLERCPLEHAIRIADILRSVTKEFRFVWEQKNFEIGASIGIIALGRDSGTLSQVLSAVDLACYMAKEKGRNRYHVYRESDEDFSRRHGEMLWVARINQALSDDRFVLYQQAIRPTHDLSGIGFQEVLVRLRNEDGTLSLPGSFMPAAERYDLMGAIDRWVVSHLFSDQAVPLNTTTVPVSKGQLPLFTINLSGASLNSDTFLDFVLKQIALHNINPRLLCFEITETMAISHFDRTVKLIQSLRGIGCHFALDDFGSGMSSFGYLKSLPVDYLKIDGAIVRHIADKPVERAMVEAINDVGHVMGLKTMAEYVENDAIREHLLAIGVDYVQGYSIEMPHPMPPPEAKISRKMKN